MKRLMVGDCVLERQFVLADPDSTLEVEFEASAVKALNCFYPQHQCIVFGGSFLYEDKISKPDLALVARDLSHWFVIEVELASHSLEKHVLPQVRAFRYGEPQPDCSMILARELDIPLSAAQTLVRLVPRGTAVVANRPDAAWEQALAAIPAQYVSLTKFRTLTGDEAVEIEGHLETDTRHLGFGTYSAVDRSFRFSTLVEVSDGVVSVRDHYGSDGIWKCTRDGPNVWLTKEVGVPAIEHGTIMQLVRLANGPYALRLPSHGR